MKKFMPKGMPLTELDLICGDTGRTHDVHITVEGRKFVCTHKILTANGREINSTGFTIREV